MNILDIILILKSLLFPPYIQGVESFFIFVLNAQRSLFFFKFQAFFNDLLIIYYLSKKYLI